jgi:AraC family L-rhamnose operon transcriptional activator RhaR
LARSLGEEHRDATPQRAVPSLVQDGARLLENDLAHEWTLSELALRLHVNKHHLARLFKEHTGLAPMAYLARCRAECAAGLLLQTNQPISEIAVRSGWLDPNLFARRFKAHFGLSATQYRARFGRLEKS